MRIARHLILTVLILLGGLAGCAVPPRGVLLLGGRPVAPEQLRAEDVAALVHVRRGEEAWRFRAPTIDVLEEMDLRRLGPLLGGGLGHAQSTRRGHLEGRWDRKTGDLQHHGVYQSDRIPGEHRYTAVRREDGTQLSFQMTSHRPDPCVPDCDVIYESLVIELPDLLLRGTPADLVLLVTLDTGHEFPVRVPAAYLRGYLEAVDAARR